MTEQLVRLRTESDSFAGAGGGTIHRHLWPGPRIDRRGAIVIVHGAFEHGGRYGELAGSLARMGWEVSAIDLPGHGRSSGQRGMIERLDQALDDIGTMFDLAELEPGSGGHTVLIGHSMGGLLSVEFALRHQDRLDGLVLLAPAITTDPASALVRGIARILSGIAPKLPIARLSPDGMAAYPPGVEAFKSDPLINQGRLPVRTANEVLDCVDTIHDRVKALTLPMLLLNGGEDEFTPPAGAEVLLSSAGSKDKTLRVYDGLKHQLNQESPTDRERVFDEISGWLEARFPARVGSYGTG